MSIDLRKNKAISEGGAKMNIFEDTGLYIHIPFCIAKCRYCDFYSLPKSEELFAPYEKRVIEALSYYRERYARRYNSLYFGGGTPLYFGEEHISNILESVMPDMVSGAEITVEGNPAAYGNIDFEKLKKSGVNRLSFGLQSSNRKELEALGRLHTEEDAALTVKAAQKAGFGNISLDLMIGVPYQTEESLRESVRFCASLGVTHISAYMLKIEEGTPLASSELRFLCADDDKASELYLAAVEELQKAGYEQYEISNFAKPGFESRHNLKYWLDKEYIGIGPSAHSFMGSRRFYFDRSIEKFLREPFGELEREESEGGGFEEYAMLRLRLKSGLDTAEASEKFGVDGKELLERAERFVSAGLVEISGETISFTPRGFLLSNALTAEILF